MAKLEELHADNVIEFTNTYSGTDFKAIVIKRLRRQEYELEIIACTAERFIGKKETIDFGQSGNKIKVTNIERPEKFDPEREAAKFLELMLCAVDTNDKVWYEELHAQYSLWKTKNKGEKTK